MEIVFLVTAILFLLPFFLVLTWLTFFEQWDDKAGAGKIDAEYITSGFQVLSAMQGITSQKNALIVDVSKWNGEINFETLKNSGVVGVIMKCGQGLAVDPRFRENWKLAKSAGLRRGTYWFFDSRVEPDRQAAIWADALFGDLGELPHFGDYEERYGGNWGGVVNFQALMVEFQELTRLPDDRLGVYTGYFYWMERGSAISFFSRYWLWIAWYSEDYKVLVPAPWRESHVLLWQFTDQGDGNGMGVESKELDLNWFVKGLLVFEQMFGAVEQIPNQTGEEVMKEIWSTRYAMSLRKAPSIFGEWVASHPIGTHFTVTEIVPPTSGGLQSDRWAHVIRVGSVAVDAWVAVIHNGVVYCDGELITDERPNPRVRVTFIDRDGVSFEADVELLRT